MHLSCLGPASRDLITHTLSSLFMADSGSSSCCQLNSCWIVGIVLPGLRNSHLEGWNPWWLWHPVYDMTGNTPFHTQFSSVQLLSHVRLFATQWTAAHQASLSITNSRSLPKPMSIESVMPSNHLIFYRPLLLLPSVFPCIRVFSNESALRIRWPKYRSFTFSISPSSKHPGLNSFRMDCLDLLADQETLKSLLQHHNSKASIFQCSAFFIVQLSLPYMTTGKTIDRPLLASNVSAL